MLTQTRSTKQDEAAGNVFSRLAAATATAVGSHWAFLIGIATVIAWVATGPMAHYSDAWQLAMNSWTNIVTFLVVFLIQNSQNRDSTAIQLKLNELIRASGQAENEMIDIEKLSDGELKDLAARYERIRAEWEQRQRGEDKQHLEG